MLSSTHAAVGAAIGCTAAHLLGGPNPLLASSLIIGSTIGSIALDVDTISSRVSRSNIAMLSLSFLIEEIFGHRGLVHTPLFIGILCIAEAFLLHTYSSAAPGVTLFIGFFGSAFILGAISHLLLDMLTPMGVMLLYPFSKKRYVIPNPIVKGKSRFEYFIFSCFILIDVFLFLI